MSFTIIYRKQDIYTEWLLFDKTSENSVLRKQHSGIIYFPLNSGFPIKCVVSSF